jgi:thioesterase domain-containing protein
MGALDAEMKAALVSRKNEVLAFLRRTESLKSLPPALVPIKIEGSKPPIFAVSGHGGDVFCLLALARHLDVEQPMFGVQPPGLDGGEPLTSVEALARYEIEQIRCYRPNGPYLIAGHCAGGTLAFEAAQQLTASGEEVALLALIGSPFPTSFRLVPQILFRLERHAKALTSGSLQDRQRYIISRLRQRLHPQEIESGISPAVLAARQRVESATVAAVRNYKPRHYAGPVDLFVSSDRWHQAQQWGAVAATMHEHSLGDFEINEMLLGSHVDVLATALQNRLLSV